MSESYTLDTTPTKIEKEISYDNTEYYHNLENMKILSRISTDNNSIANAQDEECFQKRPNLIRICKHRKKKKPIRDHEFLLFNKNKRSLRSSNSKKVTFPDVFVDIIKVESYKKYNAENTIKNPFFSNYEEKVEKVTETCACNIF